MSPITWLNSLLFVENILGIYRNYNNQTKIKKYFIAIQIFLQITFQSVSIIGAIYFLLRQAEYSQHYVIYASFCATAYVNSASSVVLGICYSGAFMSYYRSIIRVSEWFKGDKNFTNSLLRLYWFSFIFTLCSIVFVIYRSADVLLKFYDSDLFTSVTIMVTQASTRFILVLQHLMLFLVIMLVVKSLESLTSLVSAVQESVESCDVSSDEQYDVTREQIQGWVELYEDLAYFCEKVTLCFGRQFFITLTTSISNYVLIVYQMCYTVLTKNEDTDDFNKMLFVIWSYILLMMMPIVAGQLTRNQGMKLHRTMARLHNTMINGPHEVEVKLIKDFIRLIKKNPLEIKLVSKVPAGMYMLPVILTLAVNYVIVMLQFNHVI